MRFIKVLLIILFSMGIPAYSLSPSTEYIDWPFDKDSTIRVDSMTIRSLDDTDIHLWHFTPSTLQAHSCIYFLHPGVGNMSYYINRALIWAQAGYEVIMLDYRGFGRSQNLFIQDSDLYLDEFLTDFKSVRLHTQKKKYSSVGIVGLGIGTIIAQLYLLDHHDIDFAIYEGFIQNPVHYAHMLKQKKALSMTLPKSAYGYVKNTQDIKIPQLIFVGSTDDLTPLSDVNKYIQHRKKSRWTHIYDGGHLQATLILSHEYYGDNYMKICQEFINNKVGR